LRAVKIKFKKSGQKIFLPVPRLKMTPSDNYTIAQGIPQKQ